MKYQPIPRVLAAPTQMAKDRAVEHWEHEVRPALQPPPLTPQSRPRTLSEVLADDTPLPALSAEARRLFAAEQCGND
jgi:hypothetical protein